MKKYIIILLIIIVLSGCSKTQTEKTSVVYKAVTAQEAYAIINEESEYILLDVRTQEEYDKGHIKGAVLIPDYELETRAEAELPNKDAKILIYCRSGRRSKISANLLIDLGYTNVLDMGGIIDWSYGIATE